MNDALGVIAAGYGLSVMAAAAYFEWMYAQDHGFLAWLTLGAVVPALKAVAWPVFAVIALAG